MKVIVTRPTGQGEDLARRLEALGHDVTVCPLIRIESIGDDPIDASGYEWLVVTSPNGAAEVARRLVGRHPRVAAIGPGTAAALERRGIPPDLVARVSTQEGLVEALPKPSGRVLFAGAEDARPHLVESLGAEFVPLYRTVPVRPAAPPEGDLVILASASAARAFAALGLDVPAVSIGPQTTVVAAACGLRVVAEARTHDLDGLVAAVGVAQTEAG